MLVIGASASGVQIAEEIQRSGRPVTLAVGEHVRLPRRYRDRDILWWMDAAGLLDERPRRHRRPGPGPQPAVDALVGAPRTLDLNVLQASGCAGRRARRRPRRPREFSGSLRNVCALADLKLGRLLDTVRRVAPAAPGGALRADRGATPAAVSSIYQRRDRHRRVGHRLRPDLSWLRRAGFRPQEAGSCTTAGSSSRPGLLRHSACRSCAAAAPASSTAPTPTPPPGRPPRRLPAGMNARRGGRTCHEHRSRGRQRSPPPVAGRDLERLGIAPHRDVRLRALLPGGPVEAHGRDTVLTHFHGLFADHDTVELVGGRRRGVVDRLLITTACVTQGAEPLGAAPRPVGKVTTTGSSGDRPVCSGFREVSLMTTCTA